MKKIIKIVKRIIFAMILLYSFNIVMNALDIFIPINYYTIGIVALLGFPGLFTLVGLVLI